MRLLKMTKKRKNAICCSVTVSVFSIFSLCYINSQLFPTSFLPFVGMQHWGSDFFLISAVTIHHASLKSVSVWMFSYLDDTVQVLVNFEMALQ